MNSKYDTLQFILQYCKLRRTREFYQHNIGTNTRSVSALCDSKYKGRVWLKRIRQSEDKNGTYERWLYGLADWVNLDEVEIEHRYTTPICEIDLTKDYLCDDM